MTGGNGYIGSVAEEGTSLLAWDRREERVRDESVQHSQVKCLEFVS